MTTSPSLGRPSSAALSPLEPSSIRALSAVPDLPLTDTADGRNSAYPDTTYAERSPAAGRGSRTRRTDTIARVGALVEGLVGVWLAISPWVVGSGGSAVLRWNDVGVGTVLALLAVARIVRPDLPRTPSVSFGLGAWTIVAAFVLSFQNGATGTGPLWNAIACGAALTGAAAWSTTESERATLRRS